MWRQLVLEWLLVMVAIGATTLVGMFALPRLRRHIPLVVPFVLGTSCAVVAWLHLHDRAAAPASLLTALPLSRHLGWPAGLGLVVGTVLALAGARLSFWLEGALLRLRRVGKAPAGLPLGNALPSLPERAESMSAVARMAANPAAFLGISAVSATGEELLFRGAMLHGWAWGPTGLGVLGLQALLFAGVHVAFGWRTVVGKLVLGLFLGLGCLTGGLVLGALVPHLIYQWWVLRQFRPALVPKADHA